MNLTFHAEPRHGYVLVTAGGRYDLVSAKSFAERTLEACGKFGMSKALIDCRKVKGSVSVSDRYEYAVFVSVLHRQYGDQHKRQLQVAYVGNVPLIDPRRFGETVARNHGAMVKATTDMDEGLAWLGAEQGSVAKSA
jgi:histidyl-tRNA synthetase